MNNKKEKISVIIPVYNPEKKVFNRVREMLKKQNVKAEIIENWNMPEAKSMNTGIKKAKGDIIITLAQDCVPVGKNWLQNLVEPLKNEKIVVSVSHPILPKWYWKKYPLLTRVLTARELGIYKTEMDCRACAYRKKDIINAGLFSEDQRTVAIDVELYEKLKTIGNIFHPNCFVEHLHHLTNKKKLKLMYNYAEGGGRLIRKYGTKERSFWNRIIRATPFIGLFSIFYIFPYRKTPHLLPLYTLFAPIQHLIYLYSFWKGFFFSEKKSQRNLEVLKEDEN